MGNEKMKTGIQKKENRKWQMENAKQKMENV